MHEGQLGDHRRRQHEGVEVGWPMLRLSELTAKVSGSQASIMLVEIAGSVRVEVDPAGTRGRRADAAGST